MYSVSSDEELDEIVEECFRLWEQTLTKPTDVYGELYNLLYNSDESYIHKYPCSLILQLTSSCNLRCKHCFFSTNPEKYDICNDLTDEELFRQVKYFVEEVNILYCVITGGEIFSAQILLDVIKYLKKNGVIIKLITNATLITKQMALELAKVLNPKYDIIQVSLDGAKRETNDFIRGDGVYNKVITAINNLIKYGCCVEIGFTLNSKNVSELKEMYELTTALNVKSLNIGKFSSESIEQAYLVPKFEDIFYNVSKLSHIYSDKVLLRISCLKIPDFLKFKKGKELVDKKLLASDKHTIDFHCKKHHEQVTLFADGNISLCYNCSIKDITIGNIKNNTFDEIWKSRFDSPLFQERTIKNHKCCKCKYINLCLSGCLYRAFVKYGTTKAPGFECEYFEKLELS